MDINWGIINCYASFRPGEAGPEPQAPRPAPTNQASTPLDARRREGAVAKRPPPTATHGRRFCSMRRPSRTRAFLRRASPTSADPGPFRGRPDFFSAWEAAPLGAQIGTSSPCTGRGAARRIGWQESQWDPSVPFAHPIRPNSHSKGALLRTQSQGPTQQETLLLSMQHKHCPIPQALAAVIAPFVHWDIRAQTAGIYLPTH